IISAVDPFLSFARVHEAEMVATIRRFVECESPSDDAAAVSRFVELVSDTFAPFAKAKTYPGGKFGRLLVAEMQLPGRRKSGQVRSAFLRSAHGSWIVTRLGQECARALR